MNVRLWTTICAVALTALPATSAVAQNSVWPMMVVIRLNEGKDPWLYGPQMAGATGMKLVGVSPSTNTAVFSVPNETDKGQGIVAQRNQRTVADGFPGVIMSYNYGVNYPAPRDLEASRPTPPPPVIVDNGRRDFGRGNGRYRFTERDRSAVRDWYYGRRDTWNQLREGMVLDGRLRELSYPAPPELSRNLAPAPRGAQYLMVGDNLVLVDSRYQVLDMLRFSDLRDDRRGPR